MLLHHPRLFAGLGAIILAVAGSSALAAPALAAATGSVKVSGTTVQFTAAAGAANTVLVTRSGRTITLDDRVAIRAGAGCAAVPRDQTKVKCTTRGNPTLVNAALGNGNDTFANKAAVATTADGGPGNDTLTGGTAADTLTGGTGNDRLTGAAGNDLLTGGTGNDLLTGGAGTDTVSYTGHTTAVTADLDGATSDDGTTGERDTITTDVENLIGGTADDTLTGNNAPNQLHGADGHDTLHGAGGNDTLTGDTTTGTHGHDTLHGGAGSDTVSYEGRRSDVFANLSIGTGGNGSGEQDAIAPDVENLTGGSGNDGLYGNDGPNILNGGAGNDILRGGAGPNTLSGGPGNDLLAGGADADTMLGGLGIDQVSYLERGADISADLDGAKADDGETGEHDTLGSDIEKLIGGAGNDTLGGSASNDYIFGSYGNDTIRGGAGNDVLDGYYGEDKLFGDAGDDQLWAEPRSSGFARDEVDGGTNQTTLPGDTCSLTSSSTPNGCETIQNQ